MTCIIVDDESPARVLLEDNIRKFPYLELIGQARNAAEAMVLLAREKVDLMFLDIQMPGLTGLELLGSLRRQPLVILVTAFEEHALEGFELEVVDYLVKPVPLSRFAKAVQKANELFELRKLSREKTSAPQEHVFINANYSLVRVLLDEILLIEGLKDYVKIWLVSGKEIITRLSLKSVEEKLDPARFMRIHKSYIIAMGKIESVQKTQLVIGGREIPIGEGYRASLQAYLGDKEL
jgi:two-component system, LytTR family, response regulator